jgi:uncharacterized membrane protein
MYGLHALSAVVRHTEFGLDRYGAFLFSWPSIIAVIINYLTRDKVRGTWLATPLALADAHLLVRRALAAGDRFSDAVHHGSSAFRLAILVIVSTGLWVLYRVIRGWLALLDRRGMPVPAEEEDADHAPEKPASTGFFPRSRRRRSTACTTAARWRGAILFSCCAARRRRPHRSL